MVPLVVRADRRSFLRLGDGLFRHVHGPSRWPCNTRVRLTNGDGTAHRNAVLQSERYHVASYNIDSELHKSVTLLRTSTYIIIHTCTCSYMYLDDFGCNAPSATSSEGTNSEHFCLESCAQIQSKT